MRRLTLLAAVVLALVPVACGGGDDDAPATPTPTTAPDRGATPPSTSSLPPEFVRCMADQGYDVQTPDDIHSAPQPVLQTCFGSLHQSGGAP